MKKILMNPSLAFAFLFTQTPLQAALPPSGSFFTVSASGLTLSITTTTYNPRNDYPAGITITTPGYSIVSGCTPKNGRCSFLVNQNLTANIVLQGVTGNVSFRLCLNEKMPATCATYSQDVSAISGPVIISQDGNPSPGTFHGTGFSALNQTVGGTQYVRLCIDPPVCSTTDDATGAAPNTIATDTEISDGLSWAGATLALCNSTYTLCTNFILATG